jgi:dephospho-CoA kinase
VNKKKRLLIGITGGIGAGKSALGTVYRELGYPVFSADEIAREVVLPGSAALSEIRAAFGDSVILPDGTLDRAQLRARIAADSNFRYQLEAITHPRIQERSLALAQQAFEGGAEIVFYEAPLLFEAKSNHGMDKVICVHAPDSVRLARAVQRDGGSREQAEKLLKAQMPQEKKMQLADLLVENSAGLTELRAAALELLKKLA